MSVYDFVANRQYLYVYYDFAGYVIASYRGRPAGVYG